MPTVNCNRYALPLGGLLAVGKLVATGKLVARAFPVPERRHAPSC